MTAPAITAHVRDMWGDTTPTEVTALDTGHAALVKGWGHVITVQVKGEWRACFAQFSGSTLDRTPRVVGDNVEVEVLPNSSGEDRIVVVFEGLAQPTSNAIDQRIDALHGLGAAKAIEEAYSTHVHIWRETRVGCEDCGDHPALVCDGEGECPEMEGVSVPYLDLITYEDPRG